MELYGLFATLLAIGCALAATLGVGGAFNDSLDALTHFTPLYFVGGVLALLAQWPLGAERNRVAIAAALVAILVSTALMTPELVATLRDRSARPMGQTIKVVQINLWSENVDPAGTARWLAAQQADVVVLEEVIARPAGVPALLSRAYPFRNRCDVRDLCTTVILSRHRPSASGAFAAADPQQLHGTAWMTFGPEAGGFTVVGTHAPWPFPPGLQQAQSALLAAELKAFEPASLIVAGDFNATPWSFSLRRQDALFGLRRRTHGLFSWPVRPYSRYRLWTPLPLMPIDHVYAGVAWKSVSVARGARQGSDHLPIVAVLTR